MDGSAPSWLALGLGCIAICNGSPFGCTDKDPNLSKITTLQEQMLASAIDEIALGELELFSAELELFSTQVDDWVSSEREKEAVQQSYLQMMGAWQRLEVMQIGPLGSSLSVTGGLDLRDQIYSWPSTNPCTVDQTTVERRFDSADFPTAATVQSKGLDALEVLLWAGPENSCPNQVEINTSGLWDSTTNIDELRRAYVQQLTQLLIADTNELKDQWVTFAPQLTNTSSGSVYGSSQQATNAIFSALYYLDSVTLEQKLATPMGENGCPDPTCPDEVEGRLSGHSIKSIHQNIRGFEHLFFGDPEEQDAMADLLIGLGEQRLVNKIDEALTNVDEAINNLNLPLDVALEADLQHVVVLYDELSELTALFKNDVATALTMQIPTEAAGDND